MNRFFNLLTFSVLTLWTSWQAHAQVTYSVTYSSNAGNPGGINTTSDASITGWTAISSGSLSANAWTAVQTLPFAFSFYGNPVTQYKASANGIVTFDPAATLPTGNNTALPSAGFPNNSIAGFWDSFTDAPPIGSNDIIYTNTFGTAPNRQHWILWFSYEMGSPNVSFVYSAVVLEETTNKIYVVDQYSNTTPTPLLTSTVGVQLNSTTAVMGGSSVSVSGNGTTIADNDYWTLTPFTVPALDGRLTTFVTPNGLGAAGTQNVQVTLNNNGATAISSSQLNWSANGTAQTGATYTGSLAYGSNATVSLGSYNFPAGYTRLKAWISATNGAADPINNNDTINGYFCTPLAGTYTVGTPTSDFYTLQEVATALTNCGVNGAVVFNVAAGTYAGSVRLGRINGVSATNTITFEGNNAATITHNGNSFIPTVSLEGADFVTFRNFTIATTATSGGWCVLLRDTANYNKFINNTFQMPYSSGISNVYGIVASASFTSATTDGNTANYLTIEGNTFTGGSRAITMEGLTAARLRNNQIINNTISNVDAYGIFADDQDSLFVIGNTIFDVRSTLGRAVYLTDPTNYDIIKNKLRSPDWSLYISNGNVGVTPTRTSRIINNMIQATTYEAAWLTSISHTQIYHNTFNGAYSGAYVGYSSTTNTNVRIKNNIFYGINDVAFYSSGGGALTEMDYNLFYVKNDTNIIQYGSTLYSSLAAWQAAPQGHDAHSVNGDPLFASSTDLHADGLLSYNSGATNTGVTTDIDGDVRPTGAGVEMGADEYILPVNDAGVVAMITPSAPLAAGFNTVTVRVRNYGTTPLNSVQVRWTVNGVMQTPVNYNGNAIAPRTETNMIIGNVNLSSMPTNFVFWTALPNGVADERVSNDTFATYTCVPLAGTYTVGTASSNFATIDAAIDALHNCGVSAPVVFNIQAGAYTGSITLNEVVGASATNTITFDGGSAATTSLTYNGSTSGKTAVVHFDGADYITIQNMTLVHTGNSPAWGVHLMNKANYNTIRNNVITMPYTAGITDVTGIVASNSISDDFAEGNNANYTTIIGNRITGGEMGIHLEGQYSSTAGINYLKNDGNQIINNTISGVSYYGIYLADHDSIIVRGNSITDLRSTSAVALYVFNLMNFEFSKNNAHGQSYGAYISNANSDSTAQFGIFTNNMITSQSSYGVYAYDMGLVNFYHNSIRGGSYGAYFSSPQSFALDIRNNIFAGTTNVALYTANVNMRDMDNNLYYVPSGNFLTFGGNSYATLAAWQAVVGYDMNARLGNPYFMGTTNLHVQGALANDGGDNAVNITTDIDGEARPASGSTIVDIGADEFSLRTRDAAMISLAQPLANSCGTASQPVRVIVRNMGTDTITSLPISVTVSGAATATLSGTYTGTLPSGAIDSFTVGTINTTAGGVFTFTVIGALVSDGNAINDTLVANVAIRSAVTLTAVNDSVCVGTSAMLTATPAVGLAWYDAPTGGTLLATTNVFTTPAINANTTYYAVAQGCGSTRVPVQAITTTAPSISLGNDTTICSTGVATITASLAGAYTWSNGANTQQINVSAAGTYSVTVVDNNNCVATDALVVSHLATPTLTHTAMNVSCNGRTDASINFSATGGAGSFMFVWNTGATTEDISGLTAGAYTVSVTDANMCAYTYGVVVTQPATLEVDTIEVTNATCAYSADGIVDLTVVGGTMPYSFRWNNGVTTEDFIGAGAQTLYITVTDANLCSYLDTAVVTAPAGISIAVDSLINESQDLGGAIYLTATGGNPPYSFLWNTGATTDDITGLVAGTYTLQIFDTSGCVQHDTFTIIYNIPFVNVDEVENVRAMQVFPNPTNGTVWVNLELNTAADIQMDVLSTTGQLLQTRQYGSNIAHRNALDMSEYPAGVYMVRVIVGNRSTITTRVTVIK